MKTLTGLLVCALSFAIGLAYGSLCHSAFWGSKLQDKFLVEAAMTSSIKHQHIYYETALPKPYKIVHQDEDGSDDGLDLEDLKWMSRGLEGKTKRMTRLKVTVDEKNRVQEVECG